MASGVAGRGPEFAGQDGPAGRLCGAPDGRLTIVAYVGGSLTVNKADLTVTADAQTKYAGDADPLLTYQITSGGLFGTDTLSGASDPCPG